VILPLGGGSEVASAIVALNMLKPQVEIYAVQAEFSCAAYREAPLTVISLSKGLLSPTLNGLPPGPVKGGFTIFLGPFVLLPEITHIPNLHNSNSVEI